MKEVVWVYGPSAAGKESLIKFLLSNEGADLRNKLGWAAKRVAQCAESINYIAHSDDDPALEKRNEIPQAVSKLLKDADVVLIKGQTVDFDANFPKGLKEALPIAHHKIILLSVEPGELAQRLVQKKWWSGLHNPYDYSKGEIEVQGRQIDSLRGEFEIINLDSSKNNGYEFIK